MTINHAIIIIAAMFTALLAYSIWHLWFAPGAIFKPDNMNERPTFETDRSRYELTVKLEKMKAKRDKLLAEVETDYSEEKLRELNILDHHIGVTSDRVCGQWYSEGTEKFEIVKTGRQ